MSVSDWFKWRAKAPPCFALVLNSVWDRIEERILVALFDSEEMAMAYERAARLSAPGWIEDHGRTMHRTYRQDSLLWDFNPPREGQACVVPAPVDFDYDGVPANPEMTL